MMMAWYTFVVWTIHTRGRFVCTFHGHDWHDEVTCGYPGLTQRPLGIRCHRCARLGLASERDTKTGNA